MKILVIGVWGFPGSWHKAKYYPPIPPKDKNKWTRLVEWELDSKEIVTRSTTVAITRILLDHGHKVHIKIYGLDTLASPPRIRSNKTVDDEPGFKQLAEEHSQKLDEYHDTDPKNYGDILERARSVLKMFADEYFNEIDGDIKKKIMLKILPGIGFFTLSRSNGSSRKKYEFHGSPQNTAVALEYDLLKTMREIGVDAVVLDISHGINYLPVVAVEAVLRAARMYSALHGTSLPVAIFNSDPVMKSNQEARIHVINVLKLDEKPFTILKKILLSLRGERVYKMLETSMPPKVLDKLHSIINEVNKNYLGYAKVLASGIEYGLILYSVVVSREIGSKENIERLDKSIKDLEEAIEKAVLCREVYLDEKIVKIKHNYTLQHNTVMDILYLLLSLKNIAEKIKGLKAEDNLIDIDSLKKYTEEIGLSGVGRIIFDNEISDIERRVKEFFKNLDNLQVKLEEPVIYTLVYDLYSDFKLLPCKNNVEEQIEGYEASKKIIVQIIKKIINIECGGKDKCIINDRNFFAHAGLERNSIHVAMRNNKVLIGYRPQCLEEVENIIKRVLV